MPLAARPTQRRPPGGSGARDGKAVLANLGGVKLSTRLSDIELSDWQGQPVRLGSLWADRPVVLVFIRHFG